MLALEADRFVADAIVIWRILDFAVGRLSKC